MIPDWIICASPFMAGVLLLIIIELVRGGEPGSDEPSTVNNPHDLNNPFVIERGRPIVFNAAQKDQRRNEEVIIEAGSHVHQRTTGRERGGQVTVIIKDEPQTYSAQLNLRTLREYEKKGRVKLVNK